MQKMMTCNDNVIHVPGARGNSTKKYTEMSTTFWNTL